MLPPPYAAGTVQLGPVEFEGSRPQGVKLFFLAPYAPLVDGVVDMQGGKRDMLPGCPHFMSSILCHYLLLIYAYVDVAVDWSLITLCCIAFVTTLCLSVSHHM